MNWTDNPVWITIQYIAVLLLTFTAIALIISDLIVFVIALLFWAYIPAFGVALISLVSSIRCNTIHKRILLIFNLVNILLFSVVIFNPDGRCNADIMESHYTEYAPRMEQIYHELYNKLPDSCSIEIEFEHGNVSSYFFSDGKNVEDMNWSPSERKIDSLLIMGGLDRADLNQLEKELKEIGCVSIFMRKIPDKSYNIGFRRIGMGKYSYDIYPCPLTSEAQEEINKSSASIVYSPNVVFQYGGGAFGNQEFIGKEEYMQKKRQTKRRCL